MTQPVPTPKPAPPHTAFIVSHTHWDREWYRTAHAFRVQLVEVVRRAIGLLEQDGAFRHYLLDGQTIVLEDYLSFQPEDADRLRQLVRGGKLAIGPWYVLPDEFLISPEAHVRNLLIGRAVGAPFGPVQQIGYMPDAFGHIAQMPQLLRKAGIDAFVYSRGDDDESAALGSEYTWVAPDGSEVLAVSQVGGYCRGAALGLPDHSALAQLREVDPRAAVTQVRAMLAEAAAAVNADVVLISNGCDHLPPQPDMGPILDALREALPATAFRHASLAEYVAAVRASGASGGRRAGELLGAARQCVFPGVWSARTYLKQRNETAQRRLAGYLEPISAYVHFVCGERYPTRMVTYAWKLLLQTHPHDSICGCSIDEVHREMEPRFAGAIAIADAAIAQQAGRLVPPVGRTPSEDVDALLCVVNPLPVPRREVVERVVIALQGPWDADRIEVVDASGRQVPVAVVEAGTVPPERAADYRTSPFGDGALRKVEMARRDPAMRSSGAADAPQALTVQLLADLPPLGHAVFHVRERVGTPVDRPEPLAADDGTLSNGLVRVRLDPNGTFGVTHVASGAEYGGLNLLESTEDAGDEYDYAPASSSATVTTAACAGTVRVLEDTGLRARVEAELALDLPASLTPDRRRRSETIVSCPARVRVGISRDLPLVDVELIVENHARDHRLRACFPTDLVTETIISDGHFYTNARAARPARPPGWVQSATGTYPQQDFSAVGDGRRGLAVLARGLHEVSPVAAGEGTGLALTLLRAVGWLSRADLVTRPRAVGPHVPTPDAQCLGTHRFRYAVVPFAGDWLAANVKALSNRWRTPPVSVQGVAAGAREGAWLVHQHDDHVAVTAIKRHEDRDTLILRLYNLAATSTDARFTFGVPVVAGWRTSLLEDRETALDVRDGEVRLGLGPHEIATLEIAFGRSA